MLALELLLGSLLQRATAGQDSAARRVSAEGERDPSWVFLVQSWCSPGAADGTVRHVAHVLAGSGTALGLLPTGTANLLARNLAIVLDDTAQATRIALSGKTRGRLGSLAYFVSGVRALKGSRARINVAVDGRPVLCCRVRTVVVGNCGKLLAGLVLLPAAKVDDGLLDVVAIGPRRIIGWLAVC